jgi:apolipoprotein D and lipocalin family protein
MRNKYILPIFIGIIASILLGVVGCTYMGKEPSSPLQTVSHVDLTRYMGMWYEIARYPNSFQKGCVGSRATYALRDDGKVSVLNECYDGSFSGKLRSAKGKAWVVDKETNSTLKVSFFWFFAGDYWIIDIADDYSYVVVGHPKRKYLWILSRNKEMDKETYQGILRRLVEIHHYDTSKLIKTIQK